MSTEELVKRLWDEIGALREQNAGLVQQNADLGALVGKLQEQDTQLRQALADAEARIAGPAEDFCLVVTQRRHVDDTALEITGATAREWMEIAQAFAGGATDGPAPRTDA